MTKQEQYKLKFRKMVSDSSSPYYYCEMVQTNKESLALSELLSIIKKSADFLLEEINNAINGEDFDENYIFDIAPGDFDLTLSPPNAVIEQMGYSYSIPLTDLKQLLEEWIAFIKA